MRWGHAVRRAPDAERLTEALRRESPDLLRYFRRRVNEPEDAADLLAETGLTAWRRVRDLPIDAEGARRWLFTIAHNRYLNHQRGSRRRYALADRVRTLLGTADPVAAPSDDGLEVRDAIGNLAPELAEIVRLIHWDGLTVTEAAEVTGVSASTARARYQRSRAELREIFTNTIPTSIAVERGDYARAGRCDAESTA